MSLSAASRSEPTKQFSTTAGGCSALVLVLYVGSTAAGSASCSPHRPPASCPGANAPQLPAETARPRAVQPRGVDRLRLPAPHRHPHGDGGVPPQDAHADVPRDAHARTGAVREGSRRDPARRPLRASSRVIVHRRAGRRHAHGLRHRHAAGRDDHMGPPRPHRAGLRRVGAHRHRRRHARAQPGRRDRHRARVHPVHRADRAGRGILRQGPLGRHPLPSRSRKRHPRRAEHLQSAAREPGRRRRPQPATRWSGGSADSSCSATPWCSSFSATW